MDCDACPNVVWEDRVATSPERGSAGRRVAGAIVQPAGRRGLASSPRGRCKMPTREGMRGEAMVRAARVRAVEVQVFGSEVSAASAAVYIDYSIGPRPFAVRRSAEERRGHSDEQDHDHHPNDSRRPRHPIPLVKWLTAPETESPWGCSEVLGREWHAKERPDSPPCYSTHDRRLPSKAQFSSVATSVLGHGPCQNGRGVAF